jgi:DNA-directed RNA polymerase II subunit RPB2
MQVVDMVTYGCDVDTRRALSQALQGSVHDAQGVGCVRDAWAYLAGCVTSSFAATAASSSASSSSTSAISQPPPPRATPPPPMYTSYTLSQRGGTETTTVRPHALGGPGHRLALVQRVLQKELLPHCGENMMDKAVFLAGMARGLLQSGLGMRALDDRDSFLNKRVDTPGVLMASLLRQNYGKLIKDFRSMVNKEINSGFWRATMQLVNVITAVNIFKLLKQNIIDGGFKFALSTGNWGIKHNTRQGVGQLLNRINKCATMSHLRRVNTPVEKSGKLVQPRKLHGTQWGMVCPCETPEGAAVGLVKNLATLASLTQGTDSTHVLRILRELPDFCGVLRPDHVAVVLVNGRIVGATRVPSTVYERLKAAKCMAQIHPHTGVVWDIRNREIRVNTDAGRYVRPLLRVTDDNRVPLSLWSASSWIQLVLSGAVEYLDTEETNHSLIAMRTSDLAKGNKGSLHRLRYTHLEIDPALMLGVVAGCIPFSDHNQAPRNTYQSAMGKQAIGVHTTNFGVRFDTIAHVLHYPQRPLVHTRIARLVHHDSLPSGINAIVAIATFTGFNQEDSVIINQSAIDRGLFCSTVTKTYKEHNIKNHSNGEEEFFTRPDLATVRNVRPYDYSKLGPDGFVPKNTPVSGGDVIIGKCMPNKIQSEIVYKDTSVALKANESGFIDRNCCNDRYCINVNGDGYVFAKVRVRSVRIPTTGDKFATREGQKGTAGIMYRQHDMPFSPVTGITPDIIMNPHAIPSRMTIGQLLECLMGKAGCILGACGDSTPFNEVCAEDLGRVLVANGLEPHGNEVLHNPFTGRQMPVMLFIGPTYYQRLKHMTSDKIHSRAANGPVVLLTRQPAEGRAREGGLRLGEMEIECNWAHGCMAFLKERIMECSDNYRVHVCKQCGRMAIVNHLARLFQCKTCDNCANFAEVRLPYTYKLLLQELEAMSVGARLLTSAPGPS